MNRDARVHSQTYAASLAANGTVNITKSPCMGARQVIFTTTGFSSTGLVQFDPIVSNDGTNWITADSSAGLVTLGGWLSAANGQSFVAFSPLNNKYPCIPWKFCSLTITADASATTGTVLTRVFQSPMALSIDQSALSTF